MDILDSPYYRLNKFFLSCLGQWPYQKTLYKNVLRILYACVVVSIAIPQVLRMMAFSNELDNIIECLSILGVQVGSGFKLSNYIFNADKLKALLFRIQQDWKSDIFQPQLKIFEKYAVGGKKLTEFYSVYMYSTMGAYIIMPIIPKFLDMVMPLNESRANIYPIAVKYGNIDQDEYYIPIIIHADLAAVLVMTTIVATDTTYTVYVQHACGIFASLGDRLQNLIEFDDHELLDDATANKREEAIYRSIVECVKVHKAAIEFANAIESSHVVVFLFVIGLSVLCMSVAGFQMVMHLDKPNEAMRFAVFTVAQVAHIFYISWPGQKLIDHSERIYEWVYAAKWYQVSSRSKKLLMLMMMRSVEPCKLTAGKFYIMSLASFSMVMRTSMSYFTMLTSFR